MRDNPLDFRENVQTYRLDAILASGEKRVIRVGVAQVVAEAIKTRLLEEQPGANLIVSPYQR